jgi:hypothetical protein
VTPAGGSSSGQDVARGEGRPASKRAFDDQLAVFTAAPAADRPFREPPDEAFAPKSG